MEPDVAQSCHCAAFCTRKKPISICMFPLVHVRSGDDIDHVEICNSTLTLIFHTKTHTRMRKFVFGVFTGVLVVSK